MCMWATHHDLVKPAERVIRNHNFDRYLKDQDPIRRVGDLYVYFYDAEQRMMRQMGSTRNLQGGNIATKIDSKLYQANKERFVYEMTKPSDLDDLLIVKEGKWIVIQDQEGNKARGGCVVEFFVDHLGKVRFPKIIESSSAEVTESALLSLQTFSFQPPRQRAGILTYVQVRQPINFN